MGRLHHLASWLVQGQCHDRWRLPNLQIPYAPRILTRTGKHGSPQESLARGCSLTANPVWSPKPCCAHLARGMGGQYCPGREASMTNWAGRLKGGRADSIFEGVWDKRRWSFPIKRISLLKYQKIHTKKRGEKGNYISLRHTFSFKLWPSIVCLLD